MYLIAACSFAEAYPPSKHRIYACCPAINFQYCKILSFFCPMIHPSYMPEKSQGLLGVRRKRAVAVSFQLAESEDLQPAFWVRNAFRLLWSADQLYIKRCWKIILLFKYEHNKAVATGEISQASLWCEHLNSRLK